MESEVVMIKIRVGARCAKDWPEVLEANQRGSLAQSELRVRLPSQSYRFNAPAFSLLAAGQDKELVITLKLKTSLRR